MSNVVPLRRPAPAPQPKRKLTEAERHLTIARLHLLAAELKGLKGEDRENLDR